MEIICLEIIYIVLFPNMLLTKKVHDLLRTLRLMQGMLVIGLLDKPSHPSHMTLWYIIQNISQGYKIHAKKIPKVIFGLDNIADYLVTYHALDSPVCCPHELHQGGLVVFPLPLQAETLSFEVLQEYYVLQVAGKRYQLSKVSGIKYHVWQATGSQFQVFHLSHLSLGGYLSQPSSRVISKSLEPR